MNLIIVSGTLQKDITLKNGVALGNIKDGKQYFNLVAFGNKANEIKDFKKGALVVVQGQWQAKMYNEKQYYNIVVSEMKNALSDEKPSNYLDNSEIIEEENPLDDEEVETPF